MPIQNHTGMVQVWIFMRIIGIFIIMNKTILILASILIVASSVYTSKYWENKGFNVKDGIISDQDTPIVQLETICNEIDLKNQGPYKYNGTVMTGYLKVGKGNSALGFIFYGKENASKDELKNIPVVLWLNGGPGSSSQLGNYMELGPYHIKVAPMQPFEIVRNNNSWTNEYSILFVDQPVGTGLSYADPTYNGSYCKNMSDVSNDFYAALKELYTNSAGCFSQLGIKPDNNLIVFGESYGGKYAPAIGEKILREQQDNQGFLTGLKGVAIGDGFTHPYNILTQVGEYAYNLGLIDYQERTKVEQIIANATFQERMNYWDDLHDSFDDALDYIVERAGNINVYDITKYHDYPDALIGEYLNDPETKKLFKFDNNVTFGAQADKVYEALYTDFMMQYVHLVEEILRRGAHFLIYNGQNDLIVENPGTFKWAERVFYEDAEKFRQTRFETWKLDGKVAGYRKLVGKLELKTVNNAGHLVPMDQGPAALQLLKDFVVRATTK